MSFMTFLPFITSLTLMTFLTSHHSIRYAPAAIAPRLGVFAATPKCFALVAASLDVAFHHWSTAFGAGRGTLVDALLLLGLQAFLGHVFGKTSCLLECGQTVGQISRHHAVHTGTEYQQSVCCTTYVTLFYPGVKTLFLFEHMLHHVVHDVLTIVWCVWFYGPELYGVGVVVSPCHLFVGHKDEGEVVAQFIDTGSCHIHQLHFCLDGCLVARYPFGYIGLS